MLGKFFFGFCSYFEFCYNFLCSSGFWQSFEIKEPPGSLGILYKKKIQKKIVTKSVLGFKAFQRTCGFHPEITGKAKNGWFKVVGSFDRFFGAFSSKFIFMAPSSSVYLLSFYVKTQC